MIKRKEMEKIQAAGGEAVSFEINHMGVISDLDTENFTLKPGQPFKIKNDGTDAVTLEVRTSKMAEGEFIATRIDLGWNPENVVEIKMTSASVTLKWGY